MLKHFSELALCGLALATVVAVVGDAINEEEAQNFDATA